MKAIQINGSSITIFIPLVFFMFIMSYKTGLKEAFPIVLFSSTILMFIGIMIHSQKSKTNDPRNGNENVRNMHRYESSDKKGLAVLWFLLTSLTLIPVIILLYGTKETDIELDNKRFKVSGLYGLNITYREIKQIDTVSNLPKIVRNKGFIVMNRCFGDFTLEHIGKAKLFINNRQSAIIHLTTTNGKHIYLNFDQPQTTSNTYCQLIEKCKYSISE